jgi:hypothetical protein
VTGAGGEDVLNAVPKRFSGQSGSVGGVDDRIAIRTVLAPPSPGTHSQNSAVRQRLDGRCASGKSWIVVMLVSTGECSVTRAVTGRGARESGKMAQPGCVVADVTACTSAAADHSAMTSPLGPIEALTRASPLWAAAMRPW